MNCTRKDITRCYTLNTNILINNQLCIYSFKFRSFYSMFFGYQYATILTLSFDKTIWNIMPDIYSKAHLVLKSDTHIYSRLIILAGSQSSQWSPIPPVHVAWAFDWVITCICKFVCSSVCACTSSKRKTTWAINTKVSRDIVDGGAGVGHWDSLSSQYKCTFFPV